MPEFQFIGKPTDRVDALEKVMGTAKYVGDYTLPDMLVAHYEVLCHMPVF